jgi:hypothetical protein
MDGPVSADSFDLEVNQKNQIAGCSHQKGVDRICPCHSESCQDLTDDMLFPTMGKRNRKPAGRIEVHGHRFLNIIQLVLIDRP